VALYPAVDAAQKRELGSWWSPQVLLFSQAEMRGFLGTVKTVSGKQDRMFGFGFDTPEEAFLVRGDPHRRFNDFSDRVLSMRCDVLREFLA